MKARPAIADLKAGEVAKRLKLSRSYVHELIKGSKTPSLDTAVLIEREFGVPVSAWAARVSERLDNGDLGAVA
jgi:plasmid maintenance system antidote protein VapI